MMKVFLKYIKLFLGEKAFRKKNFLIFLNVIKVELVFIMFMVLPNAPAFALRIYCKNPTLSVLMVCLRLG